MQISFIKNDVAMKTTTTLISRVSIISFFVNLEVVLLWFPSFNLCASSIDVYKCKKLYNLARFTKA